MLRCSDAQMLQLAVGLSLTTTSNSGTPFPSRLCDVPPALPPSRCTPPLSPPSLPNPEQWCATVRLRLTTGTTSITIFARLLQVSDLFHFISSTHFTFNKVISRYVQKFLCSLLKHLIYKSKLQYNPLCLSLLHRR